MFLLSLRAHRLYPYSSISDMACIAEKHGILDSLMRESEELRHFSYKEWPVAFLDPTQMVSAGLYFTQYTDLVCCPFCNIVIGGWRAGDDPFERHTRLSPSCTFINQHGADYTIL
jgi:hypothetical protein